MSYVNKFNTIDVDEGTTHELIITVKDKYGNLVDISGATIIFTSIYKEHKIEKTYIPAEGTNEISVILSPKETLIPEEFTKDIFERKYQLRMFKNDKVYQITKGALYIHKAHKNYIEIPL